VAAAVTAASGGRWGYVFAGFYLLSGFLRPAAEYYRYLRQRLGHLAAEVRFPRDDVQALRVEVARLQGQADSSTHAEAELRRQLGELEKLSAARQLELERKLSSLARTFEETVDRLTDNQQIISGIKAFLRLLQQSPTAGSEPRLSGP
jgi:chromosome segregation ATPase